MINIKTRKQKSSAVLFFKLIFAGTLLSPVPSWSQSSTTKESKLEKKIVFLGDSLTEGYGVAKNESYPDLIESKIKAKNLNWKVVNASVSGSTSASGLQRANWQLKSKPDILFVALGSNDGLRGLKTEEMKKNLSSVIEAAQKAKVQVVLAGMMMPPNYGKDYTASFQKVFPDLAKQYKTDFIPFLLQDVGGVAKLNQADGIHPNKDGHKIIAETVWKNLEPILEKAK